MAFSARYDAARGAWSRNGARGLSQSVYAYAYQGAGGFQAQGRLALLTAR